MPTVNPYYVNEFVYGREGSDYTPSQAAADAIKFSMEKALQQKQPELERMMYGSTYTPYAEIGNLVKNTVNSKPNTPVSQPKGSFDTETKRRYDAIDGRVTHTVLQDAEGGTIVNFDNQIDAEAYAQREAQFGRPQVVFEKVSRVAATVVVTPRVAPVVSTPAPAAPIAPAPVLSGSTSTTPVVKDQSADTASI